MTDESRRSVCMTGIPRMLTLRQCAEETGISYEALRKLCLQGKIVYRKVGVKYLINMERLADYLNGEEVSKNEG